VSHTNMGYRVWGRNSIKNHSLTLLYINLCIKPGLNTFSPSRTSLPVQSHGVRISEGWYKGENIPNYLDRFKMASCPMKRDDFFIPNLIKTYLCGTKNGKEICYRILDCSEMGVWVLKVTITWTVRAWRPKNREYEVSLSLLQIGSNSYHKVALRSL